MSDLGPDVVHHIAYDPLSPEELPTGTVINSRLPTGQYVCGTLRHTQENDCFDAAFMPLLVSGCSEVTVQVPRSADDLRCTDRCCSICLSARMTALAAGAHRQQPQSTPPVIWSSLPYHWRGLSKPLSFTNAPEATMYSLTALV